MSALRPKDVVDEDLAVIRQRRMQELQNVINAPATAEPLEVDSASFSAFLENHPVAMVDVWASWCGPCRMMEPVVEELAAEWAGRAAVGKLNSDENQDVTMKFGIRGIPTFLFFKNGQLVAKLVGARPKRDFEEVLRQVEGKSADADQAFQ